MKVYFVSGHIDLTEEEFEEQYVPTLELALKSDSSRFVLGDASGADVMTHRYLHEHGVGKERVTVYHKGANCNERCAPYPYGFRTRGGFASHPEKDAQMTKESQRDIAWVRPKELHRAFLEAQGKQYDPNYVTGTEKNLQRRIEQ